MQTHINQGYRAPAQIEKFIRLQKLRKSELMHKRKQRNANRCSAMMTPVGTSQNVSPTAPSYNLQGKEQLNSVHFDFDNPLSNFEIDKDQLNRNIQ